MHITRLWILVYSFEIWVLKIHRMHICTYDRIIVIIFSRNNESPSNFYFFNRIDENINWHRSLIYTKKKENEFQIFALPALYRVNAMQAPNTSKPDKTHSITIHSCGANPVLLTFFWIGFRSVNAAKKRIARGGNTNRCTLYISM